MGVREACGSVRRRAGAGAALLAVAALVVAGCGGEDDFANEPRPAAPIAVAAKIDSKQVVVSPRSFGAGLVDITISNQSDDPVTLTLVGPGPEDNFESGEILPNGIGNLEAALNEGDYEVSGGERSDARPTGIAVGPPRESSSDQLGLP